jgi:hypothetical protein
MQLARFNPRMGALLLLSLAGFVAGCGPDASPPRVPTADQQAAIAADNQNFYPGVKAKKAQGASSVAPSSRAGRRD